MIADGKEIAKYLLMYDNLPHPTTGVCPGKRVFGRPIEDKVGGLTDSSSITSAVEV